MKAISIAFFILYTKITMIKEEKEIIKLDDGREEKFRFLEVIPEYTDWYNSIPHDLSINNSTAY